MKKHLAGWLIFSFVVILGGPQALPAAERDAKDSVVKIFVTANHMDFTQPWQASGSNFTLGSGAVISGKRILTSAHVVSDHTFIQVRKFSDPKKYTAKLLAIGHDCDLALLTVEDPAFFEGVPVLDLGELPHLQDRVEVMGYPTGGDKISVTSGVVSRIDETTYSHSLRRLLTVQIDAAINPGNSGGPVLKDGRLIGVAMQIANNSQSIGYIIPTPIIRHFLTDLNDGRYDGFPILGIEFNTTENQALRTFYKVEKEPGGILVTTVLPFSSVSQYLKKGDVILSLDDVLISEDGTIKFRDEERLFFSYLINQKQIGETIRMAFIRAGKKETVSVPLLDFQRLISEPYKNSRPSYYIYGGLVFSVLSADLLRDLGQNQGQGPLDFHYYRVGAGRFNTENREQVVVLLDVLPDDINEGYHYYKNQIVTKVNGERISSFKSLLQALHRKVDRFTIIETEQNAQIILPTGDIELINQKILERNSIPAQCSADVAAWLAEMEIKKK